MTNALCLASGVLFGLGAGLGQVDGRWGWLVGFGIVTLAAAIGFSVFELTLAENEKRYSRGS